MLAALIVPVILGLLALVVDAGQAYSQRSATQTAADFAALAAAKSYATNQNSAQAINAAVEYAGRNGFVNAVNQASVSVYNPPQSGPHAGDPGFFEVDITRPAPRFFAGVLHIGSPTVGARAFAGRSGGGGAIPWAVHTNFDWGAQIELEFDFLQAGLGAGNTMPARIDQPGIGNCNQATDNAAGNQYCPGIYFGTHRALCAVTAPGCTDYTITSEPGQGLGEFFPKTVAAINRRFQNTDPACNTWQEVQTNLVLNAACSPFGPNGNVNSRRVVLLIMVQNICDNTQPPCNMTITQFAPFFIDHIDDGKPCTPQQCLLEVDGYFLNGPPGFNAYSIAGAIALVQ
ncbi:MAG: pilus assembly protein TadG-related protein [Dehalococcoidia bacterium]